jgi:hypothetical protein
MARTARRTAITGILLPLATCSEASAAYVGDRFFFPSTLATTVPTPADFYNPPYFVRLPDTATMHESTFPPPIADLLSCRSSSPRRFVSWKSQIAVHARASTIS